MRTSSTDKFGTAAAKVDFEAIQIKHIFVFEPKSNSDDIFVKLLNG